MSALFYVKSMLIFLIGFSGSGKTTYGKSLARLYQYRFIDSDKLFCEQNNTTIFDFFQTYGESEFRKRENEILQNICNEEDTVISLGGGTPCYGQAIELIKKSGIVVYIKMSTISIFKRLKDSKNKRPLVYQQTDETLEQFIENALNKRRPIYEQADIIIKGENLKAELIKSSIDYYLMN